MKRNLPRLIGLLGCHAVLACNGYVEGTGGGLDGAAGNKPSTSTPDTPIATADAVALLENPPAEPVAADIACTDQAVVPRGRIWRLSAAAYENSIKDKLAYPEVDSATAPLDSVTESKFSASSRQNVVSQPWADWFFAQGEKIGAQVVTALPAPHSCMTAAGASAACTKAFIEEFAGRLFRRPLTADEVTRYQSAYGKWVTEQTPQDATWALLQAWTMSPNHVFRTELGDRKLGKVELTQYELASEISFLFGNTAPDAALLADAQQSKLSDTAVVRAHAERLLNGPAGREVLKTFFYEFLHLRELAGGGALPAAEAALLPSMQAETAGFVEDVVFNQGGGLDTLLGATTSTVDQPLASFYGVSAGTRVETKRSGLLHHAAFLNTRRDATRRGLFVVSELLCTPPAPPPPEVAEKAATLMFEEEATGREVQEVIRNAGVVCASCHTTFAPMGLAFEHYDELGKYREQHNGQALDVTGSFLATGDVGGAFTDSVDMVKKIVSSNQGQLCFSKRFVSYLQGRNAHGVLDGCLISKARQQLSANKLNLLKFMVELSQDASFYKRINLEN